MTRIIFATVMLLLCAACVPQLAQTSTPGVAAQASSDPIAAISQFTVDDLQAADKIAVDSGDDIAHACFPALVRFVQSLPTSTPSTTVSGAFSAFETARAARMKLQGAVGSGGVPSYLKIGCAALVQDEATFVIKLAALGAGAGIFPAAAPAVVGGALAPILNAVSPIKLP